jgi:hypothetical protein
LTTKPVLSCCAIWWWDNWLRELKQAAGCEPLLSIWLNGNGARANWLDRVYLGALSEKVALNFAELPGFADSESLAQLFTDGWRMDYRSPSAGRIYSACEDELKQG